MEPASAASIAGLLKSVEDGWLAEGSTVVCTVTGNGLKDPDTALQGHARRSRRCRRARRRWSPAGTGVAGGSRGREEQKGAAAGSGLTAFVQRRRGASSAESRARLRQPRPRSWASTTRSVVETAGVRLDVEVEGGRRRAGSAGLDRTSGGAGHPARVSHAAGVSAKGLNVRCATPAFRTHVGSARRRPPSSADCPWPTVLSLWPIRSR